MNINAKSLLKDSEKELLNWKEKSKKPKNDGSIPDSCFLALIDHKIKTFSNLVEYLLSLNPETVLITNTGRTEEGVKYFELVNK